MTVILSDAEILANEYIQKAIDNSETPQKTVETVCEDLLDARKENAELKEKIEKMKCCGNCNKRNSCADYHEFDTFGMIEEMVNYECINKNKWELAE